MACVWGRGGCMHSSVVRGDWKFGREMRCLQKSRLQKSSPSLYCTGELVVCPSKSAHRPSPSAKAAIAHRSLSWESPAAVAVAGAPSFSGNSRIM
ncbi:hypothetical protein NL676_017637 [Syzygium grande]|nr:hypothetical protein NL676_017637 [Syzygium grande]